jgi:hypothetical protein
MVVHALGVPSRGNVNATKTAGSPSRDATREAGSLSAVLNAEFTFPRLVGQGRLWPSCNSDVSGRGFRLRGLRGAGVAIAGWCVLQ